MTDCERCTISKPEPVPFLTHEKDMARMERSNFRLWVVILVLIGLLLATNLGWVYYEAQFTETEVTQEVDTGDGDAFVSGTGDVIYGKDQTDDKDTNP